MAGYFDESYYLKIKVKELAGTTDGNGNPWTPETVKQAMKDTGYSPEEHYAVFGRREQLNPNPYFNEAEYLQAKLAALREDPETSALWSGKGVNDLRQAMADAGMTPAEHYETIGAFETRGDGTLLNPSNAFDANAYFAAKLQQLIEKGELVNGKPAAEASVADIVAAVQKAGMSPLTHYASCGAQEAGEQGVPLVQTVPSAQRVPNDPARELITGENVPGNFNPPSPAPADAKPGPVAKPADVGGKASDSVSPPVDFPTKPLPVPGDANYVKPPAGMVDTNGKPVVIVPDSTGGLHFGVLDPESGNVMGVDPSTGTVTDTVIGKDDGTGTITPDPDLKPDAGGSGSGGSGSGGGSTGGGGGGSVPDTPIIRDISAENEVMSLDLSNANDVLSGVRAEHLATSGYLDGKGGIDTINLTDSAYNITVSRMSSFEKVNIANTIHNFNWRLSSKDYAYGDAVTIKAEDLTTGKLRINTTPLEPSGTLQTSGPVKFDVTTGTGDDDVLWSATHRSAVNLNTGAGNDRLVIASGIAHPWEVGAKPTDTVFGDISDCLTTPATFRGSFSGTNAIDLGAGSNTLVVHGQGDFTDTELKATGGTFAGVEILGYGVGEPTRFTVEQFNSLTTAGKIKVGGEHKIVDGTRYTNTSSFNMLGIEADGSGSNEVDLSKITVAAGSKLSIELGAGVTVKGQIELLDVGGAANSKAMWSYRVMPDLHGKPGNDLTGMLGQDETFDCVYGLTGVKLTGNSEDKDTLALAPAENNALITLGDGGSGGTITHMYKLEIMSANLVSGVGLRSSNIAFAANTGIQEVLGSNGNDTVDVTNLGVLTTCDFSAGNDTLKGVTTAHFSGDGSTKLIGGDTGSSTVTLEAGVYTLGSGNIQKFSTVEFKSATESVSWTLGVNDYTYAHATAPREVTVDASTLTFGTLTFDAKAITNNVNTAKFKVIGGGAADTFTGGAWGDTFTGGAGNDTFVYTTLTGSLLANHDTIVGFTTTKDRIKVSSAQKSAISTDPSTGLVTVAATALTEAAFLEALNPSDTPKMIADGAAVVTVGSGDNAVKYLVLNDGTAAFNAASDAVIAIGTSTIAVGDFSS